MAKHLLTQQILSGDRIALAKAITLAESSTPAHSKKARQIIDEIIPFAGKSIRIGITGVPGVGKSSFIEALGNYLIDKKKRNVAVLAIDPTSSKSKGSILGDKTRMENLARNENAFIRPSPSSGTQGGVAGTTRESISLCEAAGFNTVLIETVGVGQSETAVHSMVDFMLLLLLPGAGDELQGMKRGIVELADLFAINKADDNLQKAKIAQAAYRQALHLFPPADNGWSPDVLTCSARTGEGIPQIWNKVEEFDKRAHDNHSFLNRRKGQNKLWFRERVIEMALKKFSGNPKVKRKISGLEQKVEAGKISVWSAVQELAKIKF